MKQGDWMSERQRTPVPRAVQVEVFFRDGWLCSWCRRPTVFPLAFKLLSEIVNSQLPGVPIAMWNSNWRRDKAPLLDELGACIDHVGAFSTGGAHDISNFKTSCGRCNTRKNARSADEYLKVSNPWTVKGKHGEPEHWDGLASLFVLLARQAERPLTAAEKDWLRAFEAHYAELGAR
jgi:5-methylcytosine-specific restriction endonuclease McrA